MLNKSKKILLTAVKPTGALHIGNYFGAIKPFLEMVNNHQSYIFI
ncbi:MAG: tryptophan--tRNA ligase, partial [Patescibacteria group bacterium]